MKLIIGLGNPGKQYEKTRHNVGFIFLDKFASPPNPPLEGGTFSDFKLEPKFKGEISEGRFQGEKTILLKPQTFMNLSGESIRKIVDFYKIDLEDIIVIYDDKDMEFGKVRFRETGSAGGHNGIKSIISHFGKDFKRIKIGIGYDHKYDVSDWVLGKFDSSDLAELDSEIYEKVLDLLKKKHKSPIIPFNKGDENIINYNNMKKQVYFIGIGGIGISALARYYLHIGYEVFGSDMCNSELIEKLKEEGMKIETSPLTPLLIGDGNLKLEKIIYTEAVPKTNPELQKAKELNIPTLTYPEALAEVVNSKKLIAIAGTHGKSTTTSLTSLVLKNSEENVNTIVGTILKEFGQKNAYFSNSPYFVIEACEYKRSFLKYKPTVAVIVNIEIDHLDYYKDLEDYISAYKEFIENVKPGGFVILNGKDKNCKKLLNLRSDINYIEVFEEYFITHQLVSPHSVSPKGREVAHKIYFPEINIKVPGNHILFDAKLAYVVGHMVGIHDYKIIESLENYSGVWRRMEIIGKTKNGNTLMSDYGHHPTEIRLTLEALKENFKNSPIIPFYKGDEHSSSTEGFNPLNSKKILTIFQPHQYNRTLELLEDFKTCFSNTDTLIVPNIYESRDSEEDKEKINSKIFVEKINHPDKIDGENFEKTLDLINQWDKKNKNSIIILMGAGNIDNLREKIKTS